MIKCPKCGGLNSEGGLVCENCGERLQSISSNNGDLSSNSSNLQDVTNNNEAVNEVNFNTTNITNTNEKTNNFDVNSQDQFINQKKKKFKLKYIVIIALIAIITPVIIFSIMSKPKKAISDLEFLAVAQEQGYTVKEVDVPSDYKDLTLAAYEISDGDKYTIYFFSFLGIHTVDNVYNIYSNDLDKLYNNGGFKSKEFNTDTYQSHTLSSKDKYYYLIKIKRTLLSVEADTQYKKEVNKLIKAMGY